MKERKKERKKEREIKSKRRDLIIFRNSIIKRIKKGTGGDDAANVVKQHVKRSQKSPLTETKSGHFVS